jgi:hypothetical protein
VDRDFLPPEAPGPEPDLGDQSGQPTQPAQPLPPPQQQQYQPPPQYQQPPPQYQQPYGYGPPPGYYAWGPPPPREPDNNPAVAGFVLSMVGGGLLFFFAGLSTIISLGLSIAGIVYSRKGKEKVDRGETTKQRGLAQAGFIIGIVSTVLSLLATVFWILFIVLIATDEEFRRDLEDNNSGTIAIALVRGLISLL